MRPAAIAIGLWLILQTAESAWAQAPDGGPPRLPPLQTRKNEPVEEVQGGPVSIRNANFREENAADRLQQQPGGGQPPAGGILDNRVDRLLEEWSKKTQKIQTLYVTFVKTTEDKIWGTKGVAEGSARYFHPNRARLDVQGEDAESYVLTGNEIWHYRVALQQIVIYELPAEMQKKDRLQDGPLPFLFAAEPNQAKARYRFQIIKEDAKQIQLLIVPKFAKDQEDFKQAEVWLDRDKLLPNRLYFIEHNGNRVTFDFKGIWQNIDIKESDFVGQIVDKWQVSRKKLDDEKARRSVGRQNAGQDR